MTRAAATLNSDSEHGAPQASMPPPRPAAGTAMKFFHKSGDKPLDGFTIKRGVGLGGFGEVYFAVSDAGKEVALKRIQRNLDIEVRGVTQCLNLKHVHLISLFDIRYDAEGQAWVVMEFVGGESLKDVIDRNPNGMPLDEVDQWFRGIAAGVAYLHDHGIVHRDLKPGNLFTDDGVVKVGDYGLSKFISCSRRSGQTESVGTFHYMAPEIGKGVYGKEIDIYALGILLYEMITGRVPFDGESTQEIIMKHLTDDPDLSGIPQPYREAIHKALRKDPEKRFRKVGEMLDALHKSDNAAQAVAEKRSPTPASAERVADTKPEPVYIDEQGLHPESGIVFGPVKHHPPRAIGTPPIRGQHEVPVMATAVGANPTSEVTGVASQTWAKVLLVLTLWLVILFNPWLLPIAAVIAAPYLIYLVLRALFGSDRQTTSTAHRLRHRDVHWQVLARKALHRKPMAERISELSGSMLLAGLISAAVSFVLLLLVDASFSTSSLVGWSRFAWLVSSSTLGSWLLLTLGKCWEASDGDHFRRRFVMLVAGLAIGAVTFGASQVFLIDFSDSPAAMTANSPASRFASAMYSAEGSPLIAAHLVYFAGLFLILRWWMQVDPLRRARMSLMATGSAVLWAWIMQMFCQFPQPWGVMLAASISIAVQLSAPWVTKAPEQAGA